MGTHNPARSIMKDPYNLPDQAAQDEASQAKSELQRKQQEDDLKWLMAHAAGRRIATRIIEETGTRRTSFHPSGSIMAFNEGKRTVGLWFEGELLAITPEGYIKLLKEYASE